MSQNAAAAAAVPSDRVAGIKDGLLGILNVFIDPVATAQRVKMRWFWIYPFVVMSAVAIFVQIATTAYRSRATEIMMRDQGLSPEAIQTRMAMGQKFAFIGWILTPIMMLIFLALSAWLMSVAASIVDAGARYRDLLSLAAVTGMFYAVQMIAGVLVLRSKSVDDITSMRDLQPPFGLDIFIHDLPKALQALVGFFSVFQVWAIIMSALTFAAMTRVSKGKAFFVTSPGWVLGMILAVVMGSIFG